MSKELQTLERALPIGSIEAYTYWVNQIPMLSKEEEYSLAKKLKNKGDLEAAKKLVLAHLRFVVHVAKSYVNYGLSHADLIQEGTIGLMKAVKRFNPEMGVRLVSFAVHWIKAEIHEYILRNFRIVKMATTKAQRKLFFNVRKMARKMGRLGWLTESEINTVAKELKVKPHEVANMEMRLNGGGDIAFDGFGSDDEPDWNAPANYLVDSQSDPAKHAEADNWSATREHDLAHSLECLDERSKDIIMSRWLQTKKATLQELAGKYNVSAERIRQLEEAALLKLKKAIAAA